MCSGNSMDCPMWILLLHPCGCAKCFWRDVEQCISGLVPWGSGEIQGGPPGPHRLLWNTTSSVRCLNEWVLQLWSHLRTYTQTTSQTTISFTPHYSPHKVKFVHSLLLPMRAGPADVSIPCTHIPHFPYGAHTHFLSLPLLCCKILFLLPARPSHILSPTQKHHSGWVHLFALLFWHLLTPMPPFPTLWCSLPHWTVTSFRTDVASQSSLCPPRPPPKACYNRLSSHLHSVVLDATHPCLVLLLTFHLHLSTPHHCPVLIFQL